MFDKTNKDVHIEPSCIILRHLLSYTFTVQKIEKLGLPKEEYWWYLELRKYGSIPHGGFGVGFERFMQFITGVENVRDVIPFPRVPGHADF